MEGKALMQEAEKKLSSHSWFSKGTKYEDAAELFTNAANKFKNDKLCTQVFDATRATSMIHACF